jgi:hypothetical protein
MKVNQFTKHLHIGSAFQICQLRMFRPWRDMGQKDGQHNYRYIILADLVPPVGRYIGKMTVLSRLNPVGMKYAVQQIEPHRRSSQCSFVRNRALMSTDEQVNFCNTSSSP